MLRFGVLGPVVIFDEHNEPRELGPRMVRGLATALLLAQGHFVSHDELIDLLWMDPPRSAMDNLRSYAYRLRRRISLVAGGAQLISRRGGLGACGGYCISVDRERVDSAIFADLALRGRDKLAKGLCTEAADLLAAALKIWRGLACEDGPDTTRLRNRLSVLEEHRRVVAEEYFAIRLARGEVSMVLPEIMATAYENPLRESSWRQLIQARYLSGDANGAVGDYRILWGALSDQLGLQPAPATEALHQAVLRRDDVALRVSVRNDIECRELSATLSLG